MAGKPTRASNPTPARDCTIWHAAAHRYGRTASTLGQVAAAATRDFPHARLLSETPTSFIFG